MTLTDYVFRVLAGTPSWVWGVFVLLLVLGVRRLKLRQTHLAFAALAPIAFTIWSLAGVVAAARGGQAILVGTVWFGALVTGTMTVLVHRGPRPTPLGRGVFLFPRTAIPLLIYMAVFWTRYALGVWAAFRPDLALTLTLVGIAVSAATAGRFIVDFAPLLRAARRPEDPPVST